MESRRGARGAPFLRARGLQHGGDHQSLSPPSRTLEQIREQNGLKLKPLQGVQKNFLKGRRQRHPEGDDQEDQPFSTYSPIAARRSSMPLG